MKSKNLLFKPFTQDKDLIKLFEQHAPDDKELANLVNEPEVVPADIEIDSTILTLQTDKDFVLKQLING